MNTQFALNNDINWLNREQLNWLQLRLKYTLQSKLSAEIDQI